MALDKVHHQWPTLVKVFEAAIHFNYIYVTRVRNQSIWINRYGSIESGPRLVLLHFYCVKCWNVSVDTPAADRWSVPLVWKKVCKANIIGPSNLQMFTETVMMWQFLTQITYWKRYWPTFYHLRTSWSSKFRAQLWWKELVKF